MHAARTHTYIYIPTHSHMPHMHTSTHTHMHPVATAVLIVSVSIVPKDVQSAGVYKLLLKLFRVACERLREYQSAFHSLGYYPVSP